MIPMSLNEKLAENHYQMVKDNLENRIKRILKLKRLSTKHKTTVDDFTLRYLSRIIKGDFLQSLIISKPDNFNRIIKFHDDLVKTNKNFKEVLNNLFINSGYNKLDKSIFIAQFNLDTCPYCNRNYIYSFKKNKGGGSVKPQIDHFYPKDKYPYLGISFYNLIPSCLPCNGLETKRNYDPKEVFLLSPYEIKENDFHFSVDITGLDFSKTGIKDSFDLELKSNKEGNVEMFHLNEFYQLHKDHALELIMKSEFEYSDVYKEMLTKIDGLNLSKEEINRMIVGNYVNVDELHKRPLSKMYRDLAIDLGLID